MTRENAATKGRRYLVEGRLTVHAIRGPNVRASCRGDGATYTLTHDPGTGWACTCPARGRCAHLTALGLVVDVTANPTSTERKHP